MNDVSYNPYNLTSGNISLEYRTPYAPRYCGYYKGHIIPIFAGKLVLNITWNQRY